MIKLFMSITLVCFYATYSLSFYEPDTVVHDSLVQIKASINDLYEAPLCKGVLLNLWQFYKARYGIPVNEVLDLNDNQPSYSRSFCESLTQVMAINPLFGADNLENKSNIIYQWFNHTIKPIFKLIHGIPEAGNGNHMEL